MYATTLELGALDALTRDEQHRALNQVLLALAKVDAIYLRRHPQTPPLYRSGVVYRDEPDDGESWADVSVVLNRGFGHCAELAAWRTAELWRAGNRFARPIVTEYDRPDLLTWHAIVQVHPWRTEDPSLRLGMKGF